MNKTFYDTFDTVRFSDLVLEDKEAADLKKKVIESPTQDKESDPSLKVTKTKTPEQISYWINFGHFREE